MSKNEQIITYITGLKLGTKLSVRAIADELGVSEGTAYKAIKDAESLGLVSTKERIGTVRIERKRRGTVDRLTFGEVAGIVEGQLLGGSTGLDLTLNKVVIGAMQLQEMSRYIDAGSLLIVGNREGAQRIALDLGAGVLITGGFDASESIRELADHRGLPLLSSKFDTYTVASMLNRALFDRLIKQKIMLVEDIVTYSRPVETMGITETVADFYTLSARTGRARFPVLDERGRVVGMMTLKDAEGVDSLMSIERVMSARPITAAPNIPIASAAHTMAAEGIELLPIVDKNRKLLATLSRAEVWEAMRYAGKSHELGETFDDLMNAGFERVASAEGAAGWVYRGRITPQMSGPLGTISEGVIVTLMVSAARVLLVEEGKRDHGVESCTSYFLRPLQLESDVWMVPRLLEMSRKSAKVEVEFMDDSGIVAKSIMTAQLIEPN